MNSEHSLEDMIVKNLARQKGIDEDSARRFLANDEKEVEQGEFVMEGNYTALDVIAKFDEKHVSKIIAESSRYDVAKTDRWMGASLREHCHFIKVIEAFNNSHPNYRIDDIISYCTDEAVFSFSKVPSNKSPAE